MSTSLQAAAPKLQAAAPKLQAAAPNPKDLARALGLSGQSVAWLAVAWGVLCVIAGVFVDQEFAAMVAMVLVGTAFLIPSLWWLRCASKDRKAVKRYEDTVRTNTYLSQFLTEADQVVIQGMGTPRPPEKTPRHWPGVSALSAVLVMAGLIILPAEEEPAPTEPAPAAAYYKNCTAVWNAIGSPIYAGQPGYDSHLDRDGDGIGCEQDPR